MKADDHKSDETVEARHPGLLSKLRRLLRSKDGATAIEFAMLAIPYFMIIFAIIETFVAFTAEQLVTNAVDVMGRQLRTGQITYNMGRATDKDQAAFRQLFCNEISIMISCSAAEIATPSKLYLDVETYSTFGAIPTKIPYATPTDPYSDINPSGFKYAPGGPSTINMLRAYYRWQITADIIRPYITTIHTAGKVPTDFLIVATAAFQNEKYP
jgi:Flp pilus assembly protein TadG